MDDDDIRQLNDETRGIVKDAIRTALLSGGSVVEVEAGIVAAFEMLKGAGAKAAPAPVPVPEPWRGEMDRLHETVKALIDHAMTPGPPPTINVSVPERSTTVNVPRQDPPQVNFSEGAIAVPVTVSVPESKAVTRKVKRDKAGLITEITDG